MARTYEKVEEKVKRDELVSLTCDICGKEAQNPDPNYRTWEWGQWEACTSEVHLSLTSGDPDGGGEGVDFDICPECFMEKLVPWVRSHRGAEPRTYDW